MKIKITPFKSANGRIINEIEIPEVQRVDEETKRAKFRVFLDTDGWWIGKNTRGKCVLGVVSTGDKKRWWPSAEDMHKILIGWIIATARNDIPQEGHFEYRKRTFERDFSPVKALAENLLREIRRYYGQEFLDRFFKEAMQ